MRLNVRCCCLPQRVLGSIDLPEDLSKAGTFRVPMSIETGSAGPLTVYANKPFAIEYVTVEVREFQEREAVPEAIEPRGVRLTHRELAIFSDDRPVQFWRKFPSFIEAQP